MKYCCAMGIRAGGEVEMRRNGGDIAFVDITSRRHWPTKLQNICAGVSELGADVDNVSITLKERNGNLRKDWNTGRLAQGSGLKVRRERSGTLIRFRNFKIGHRSF